MKADSEDAKGSLSPATAPQAPEPPRVTRDTMAEEGRWNERKAIWRELASQLRDEARDGDVGIDAGRVGVRYDMNPPHKRLSHAEKKEIVQEFATKAAQRDGTGGDEERHEFKLAGIDPANNFAKVRKQSVEHYLQLKEQLGQAADEVEEADRRAKDGDYGL